MLFSEIAGHNKIKDVLARAAVANRVGHAYIFEGQRGVGKCSVAMAFAQRLVCENPNGGEACGICTSCSRCNSKNHPDIQLVTNQLYDPSKKTVDILLVDTIRDMKRDVYIKPYESERKIYIIPKADTMNISSQNSLLKVLEEPPEYCTIILLAENSNSFLPTILSRAVTLKFFPNSEDEVREWLVKNSSETDTEKIDVAARLCGGSIGKAKELLESTETVQLRDEFIDRVFALSGGARRSIYDFSLFLKQNKDEISFLMNVLQEIFRDVLYIKQGDSIDRAANSDKKIKLQKFADYIHTKNSVKLLELLIKYNDYFSKNIGLGAVSQCLGLELWEAINDRGYRSKIQ